MLIYINPLGLHTDVREKTMLQTLLSDKLGIFIALKCITEMQTITARNTGHASKIFQSSELLWFCHIYLYVHTYDFSLNIEIKANYV